MDTSSNNFGLRLRSLIEKKGRTVEAFAEEVGIARSTAHNWLKSDRSPLKKYWQRLSEYFGVSETYIGHGRPSDSPQTSSRATVGIESSSEQNRGAAGPGLASEARRRFDQLLDLAAGNVHRIGWIIEELESLIKAKSPEWEDVDALAIQDAHDWIRKNDAARKAAQRQAESEREGKAG